MLERHDPRVRSRARSTGRHHLGLETEGVANEDRHRERRLVEAQVGHRGTQRRVTHAHADHQAQSQQAVHESLAELGVGRELGVEVQGLRVMSHETELQVVGLGNRAGQGMAHHEAHRQVLEPATRRTIDLLATGLIAHARESDRSSRPGSQRLASFNGRDPNRRDSGIREFRN